MWGLVQRCLLDPTLPGEKWTEGDRKFFMCGCVYCVVLLFFLGGEHERVIVPWMKSRERMLHHMNSSMGLVATRGGQEGVSGAPCSVMPAPATDERCMLHVCVVPKKTAHITCMAVATERKCIPHFYCAHRGRGGSIQSRCNKCWM